MALEVLLGELKHQMENAPAPSGRSSYSPGIESMSPTGNAEAAEAHAQ
jgi:hypothetical protein